MSTDIADDPRRFRSVSLSLSSEERWTLHHVLLDRIEQEATADDPSNIDPPPIEVFQAFETLDDGEASFTVAQLEAIRSVLAEYHHASSEWETERSRLETLLERVSENIDQHRATLPAD